MTTPVSAPPDWAWGNALWTECSGVVTQLLGLAATDPQLARYEQAIDHMTRLEAQGTARDLTDVLLDTQTLNVIAQHIDDVLARAPASTPDSFWQKLRSSMDAQRPSNDLAALKHLFATVYQQRERAQHLTYQLQQAQQQQHREQQHLEQHLTRLHALLHVLTHALKTTAFAHADTAERITRLTEQLDQRRQTLQQGQLYNQQQQLAFDLIQQQQQQIQHGLEHAYLQLQWIGQTQQLSEQAAWRERLMQSRQSLPTVPQHETSR